MNFNYLITSKVLDNSLEHWFLNTTSDPVEKAFNEHGGDIFNENFKNVVQKIFASCVSNSHWGEAAKYHDSEDVTISRVAKDLRTIAEKAKFYKEACALVQESLDAAFNVYPRPDRTIVLQREVAVERREVLVGLEAVARSISRASEEGARSSDVEEERLLRRGVSDAPATPVVPADSASTTPATTGEAVEESSEYDLRDRENGRARTDLGAFVTHEEAAVLEEVDPEAKE